jgi:hypothetical protein
MKSGKGHHHHRAARPSLHKKAVGNITAYLRAVKSASLQAERQQHRRRESCKNICTAPKRQEHHHRMQIGKNITLMMQQSGKNITA